MRRGPGSFRPSTARARRRAASPGGTNLTAEASGAWTLDVWGQVRREIEAQQAGAETNAAILANATLAAQSALALAYVTLRQADSLEDLLAGTIEDYKRSVTITQNQYNAGTAAKSDVITAQAQLLNAQAAFIAAGVSRAQSEHAIAVLMGRPPAGLSIPHGSLATRVPPVPVGLPSSLLERRPDVAAAEETMRQANAEIGVEFAGYFPAVSLSGLIGYSGNPFATQFGPSNPVWSFGASLAQPLFNGGLTTAQVEAARQTYQADVATYRQTVLIPCRGPCTPTPTASASWPTSATPTCGRPKPTPTMRSPRSRWRRCGSRGCASARRSCPRTPRAGLLRPMRGVAGQRRRGGRDLQLAARQAGDADARLRPMFAELLAAVGAVEGIRRVRFTSPHPKDMRAETFAAMAATPSVCEHLHYPLQSGSDRVLAAMHRGYTAQRYLERLAAGRAVARRPRRVDRHHRRLPGRDRRRLRGHPRGGCCCGVRLRVHVRASRRGRAPKPPR